MEMADKRLPVVSVILPFYNAPYLKDAINSILNQTFQDFELILIDNCSTDTSVAIAKSFNEHPKVTLVEERKRGVVHAANAGISVGRGQFFARMDADDIAFEKRLEIQVEKLQQDHITDVVSGLIEYLGSNDNKGFIHYINWLNTIISSKEIYLNQFVEFPIANPTMMFRRELFERYGLYNDGDFPEDYELFLRLQSNGVYMEKVEEKVLQWRDSENRLTRTDAKYTQAAFFKIKSKYLAAWLSKNNPYHPRIYVWGAGRLSRRRSEHLIDHGIDIVKYIDLRGGKNVIHYGDLPKDQSCFVVSYVANRGARVEIRNFLETRDYIEGVHYIMAS